MVLKWGLSGFIKDNLIQFFDFLHKVKIEFNDFGEKNQGMFDQDVQVSGKFTAAFLGPQNELFKF